MPSKRNICEVHDELVEVAIAAVEEAAEIQTPGRLRQKVRSLASKVKKLAKEAKKYGQSMENRMSEYREAIEALGFTRDE